MNREEEAAAWGPQPEDFGEDDEQRQRRIRAILDVADVVEAKRWRRPTWVGSPPLEVTHDLDTRWVEIRGALALPAHFIAVVRDERYPWTVLDLAVEEREVVCNRVTFIRKPGDPSLRATEIRRPIDGFKREAEALAAARLGERADGTQSLIRNDFTSDEYLEVTDPIRRERRRGRRLEDDELREAAAIYRTNLAGGKPIKALMREKNIEHSTAHRWITEARRRGFLEPDEVARPKKPAARRRRTRKEA